MSKYSHLTTRQLELAAKDPNMGKVQLQQIAREIAEREMGGGAARPGPGALRDAGTLLPRSVSAPAHTPGRMDANEARYAAVLDAEGATYFFEAVTLTLGVERTRYTPDFFIPVRLQFVEVKGPWGFKAKRGAQHPEGRVKFQVAARMHPWARWTMVQWIGGEWRTLYDYPNEEARAA